jgi:hypothetical protein
MFETVVSAQGYRNETDEAVSYSLGVCYIVLPANSQFTHTVDPIIDCTVALSNRNDSYSDCARQATK